MRRMIQASFIPLMLAAATAGAQTPSPVGLWKTVDDASGKATSLIRISEVNGELQGRIEKLLAPNPRDPNPRCGKCEGERKDQPIVGMLFMSGLKKASPTEYGGGEILDPDNGKTYRSKVTLIEGGNKLDVRGYIGVPLLGRSQVWLREQ